MATAPADAGTAATRPAASGRHRHRVLWLVRALLVVALLAWGYAGIGGDNPAPAAVVQGGTSSAGVAADHVGQSNPSATGGTSDGHAVILPEQSGDGAATAAVAPVVPGGNAVVATPGSPLDRLAAEVDGEKAAPKPVAHRRVRHRSRSSDSDVNLLTALLEHVEDGQPRGTHSQVSDVDPAVAAMQKCAAANTSAGVLCRTRVCKKYEGRSAACPEPTPVADKH